MDTWSSCPQTPLTATAQRNGKQHKVHKRKPDGPLTPASSVGNPSPLSQSSTPQTSYSEEWLFEDSPKGASQGSPTWRQPGNMSLPFRGRQNDVVAGLRAELEKTKREAAEAEERCKAEIRDLQDDLKVEQDYTADLRTRYKALRTEHHKLVAQRSNQIPNECDGTSGPTFLNFDVETGASVSGATVADIPELHILLEDMERDKLMKQPLFQIGLDIRTRFLEQAREPALSIWRGKLDSGSIELGNQAAHSGMGDADAAIFKGGYLSRRAKARLFKVFEELYHYKPSEYGTLPQKVKQAIDCQVTIRTLKALNSGMNRPLKERQLAMDNIDFILQKHGKLSLEEFEADVNIGRRLEVVRDLTETIVEFDRRQGDVRNTRTDSSY